MPHYSTRLKTFDYTGEHRYSLTMCTVDREEILTEPQTARETIAQIARAAEHEGFNIPVYCLMPDHAHLLGIGRGPRSDLRRFIRMAKQLTEFAHRQRTGHGLWQRSVWDRVLREPEDTFVVGRYILNNPVRAGLVETPVDWPWSGSLTLSREDLFQDAFAPSGQRRERT